MPLGIGEKAPRGRANNGLTEGYNLKIISAQIVSIKTISETFMFDLVFSLINLFLGSGTSQGTVHADSQTGGHPTCPPEECH